MKFATAAQVRKFLKSKGFAHRVSVRRAHNPFGGEDKWAVTLLDVPKGVAVATKSISSSPTKFYTSDQGKTARVYAELQQLLKGTNTLIC